MQGPHRRRPAGPAVQRPEPDCGPARPSSRAASSRSAPRTWSGCWPARSGTPASASRTTPSACRAAPARRPRHRAAGAGRLRHRGRLAARGLPRASRPIRHDPRPDGGHPRRRARAATWRACCTAATGAGPSRTRQQIAGATLDQLKAAVAAPLAAARSRWSSSATSRSRRPSPRCRHLRRPARPRRHARPGRRARPVRFPAPRHAGDAAPTRAAPTRASCSWPGRPTTSSPTRSGPATPRCWPR